MHYLRWSWTLAVMLLLSLLFTGYHGQGTPNEESNRAQERLSSFLVTFSDEGRATALSAIENMGGRTAHRYRHIPAISVMLPDSALSVLRRTPGILNIERDGMVQAVGLALTHSQTVPWGIDRINAPDVHDFTSGTGVKVAIIDTGISMTHPDLAVAGGTSFVSGTTSPDDDNGHGTHVAGTVAALNNHDGVLGAAPTASLYAVKVLNSGGGGSWSDVIAGIDWAIDNDMDVINMSLGASTAPSAARTALLTAYDAGIVIVAAAGNSGNSLGVGDNVIYPARWPEVIAVAAINESNERTSFSSTGSPVELAAPGVNVLSTTRGGGYGLLNGTSMASPHVAGVVALLLSSGTLSDQNSDGRINNVDVRLRMQRTAQDLGSAGKDSLYGYGLVDADAAVVATVTNRPPTADSGGPYSGRRGVSITFNGSRSVDPDGDPLTYSWSFGDGSSATGVAPSHTYTKSGTFLVSLTVSDGRGGSDSDLTIASIEAGNGAPVADAGPDQTAFLGEPVTFDASASLDPDGTVTSYQWTFGDGSSATGATASHTYSTMGIYTVVLTVTDNEGATDSDAATVTVLDPEAAIIHVTQVDMTLESRFRGWRTWAEASVQVVDASGSPIEGVTVTGEWSNATTGTRSQITNASGVALFQSDTLRRPSSGTTFRFTVTNLTKAGHVYDSDADVERTASVTVP